MKKYLLFAALFFLAAPAAFAYDFGTAGVVAALGIGGAVLALVFGAPAALGTVAIGALVAGITFPTPSSDSSASGAVEVQLSPSAKLATPSGWTAPASGQVEPSPPSSVASSGAKYFVNSVCCSSMMFSTADAACKNYAVVGFGEDPSIWSASGSTCYRLSTPKTAISLTQGCPSGYSWDGSTCVLQDANQAQKPSDGVCTIKRTGNSFGVDSRDPDCASGKIPATTSISPNVITTTNSDGSSKSVTINTDGSTTVSESRPNNSTNTTETNTTTFSAPDASGQVRVTGQGSGVAPGTGTQAGSSAPPVNVNFDKSGLATEGTLNGIKADTDAIKNALDGTGVDSSLQAQKSAFDSAVDSITGMFSGEAAKDSGLANDFSVSGFLPASCGCSPLHIEFHGHVANFDWCAPMETFKGALAWVLGMLTGFYILSLFRVGGSK